MQLQGLVRRPHVRRTRLTQCRSALMEPALCLGAKHGKTALWWRSWTLAGRLLGPHRWQRWALMRMLPYKRCMQEVCSLSPVRLFSHLQRSGTQSPNAAQLKRAYVIICQWACGTLYDEVSVLTTRLCLLPSVNAHSILEASVIVIHVVPGHGKCTAVTQASSRHLAV